MNKIFYILKMIWCTIMIGITLAFNINGRDIPNTTVVLCTVTCTVFILSEIGEKE